MSTQVPEDIRSVYFIGIAGIGMSALARYFSRMGVDVSGYDADRSALAKALEEEGMVIHYTEDESVLPEMPDLVVYTPAIPDGHVGLQHFRKLDVPVLKRSAVLGWISSRHKCIAVAGTHGKTTTSAMITCAMRGCGVDVTAFLGGLVLDFDGNFVQGDSEWLIAEADEYDRSFLALSPQIAIVTAMDADHLDVYGSYSEMVAAYTGFLQNVREGGKVILQEDVHRNLDGEILNALTGKNIEIRTYGIGESDYRVEMVRRAGEGVQFVLGGVEGVKQDAQIRMPGMHNVMNATAAIVVCDMLGLDMHSGIDALKKFSGIKRRFEIVHAEKGLVIIDDYAHHPEELAAAISAARLQYPDQKITGVFQPHLYSRTRDFYREFAKALEALDTCILVELYPARELPIEGVNSKMIFDQIKNDNRFLTTKQELIPLLESLRPQVLLLLGAGDLDRMIPEIKDRLQTT